MRGPGGGVGAPWRSSHCVRRGRSRNPGADGGGGGGRREPVPPTRPPLGGELRSRDPTGGSSRVRSRGRTRGRRTRGGRLGRHTQGRRTRGGRLGRHTRGPRTRGGRLGRHTRGRRTRGGRLGRQTRGRRTRGRAAAAEVRRVWNIAARWFNKPSTLFGASAAGAPAAGGGDRSGVGGDGGCEPAAATEGGIPGAPSGAPSVVPRSSLSSLRGETLSRSSRRSLTGEIDADLLAAAGVAGGLAVGVTTGIPAIWAQGVRTGIPAIWAWGVRTGIPAIWAWGVLAAPPASWAEAVRGGVARPLVIRLAKSWPSAAAVMSAATDRRFSAALRTDTLLPDRAIDGASETSLSLAPPPPYSPLLPSLLPPRLSPRSADPHERDSRGLLLLGGGGAEGALGGGVGHVGVHAQELVRRGGHGRVLRARVAPRAAPRPHPPRGGPRDPPRAGPSVTAAAGVHPRGPRGARLPERDNNPDRETGHQNKGGERGAMVRMLGAMVWMLGAMVGMLEATVWILGATVWMLGATLTPLSGPRAAAVTWLRWQRRAMEERCDGVDVRGYDVDIRGYAHPAEWPAGGCVFAAASDGGAVRWCGC
eukprot:1183978-Prorocentrum_minimum.AAC.2